MAGCLGHWVTTRECGWVSRALGHKESVAGCLGHWVTRRECGWVSRALGHKES